MSSLAQKGDGGVECFVAAGADAGDGGLHVYVRLDAGALELTAIAVQHLHARKPDRHAAGDGSHARLRRSSGSVAKS